MTWEWVILILGLSTLGMEIYNKKIKTSDTLKMIEKVSKRLETLSDAVISISNENENFEKSIEDLKKAQSQQNLAQSLRR